MGIPNAEKSHDESIFSLNISKSFDQTAPFSNGVKSFISV